MTSKAVNITNNKAAKFNKKKYEKERKQKRLKKAINVFLSLQDIQYWFDCVVGLSFALVTTIILTTLEFTSYGIRAAHRDQALANHRQPNNKHTDWQPPRDHTQVNASANPANRHKLRDTVASCRHV